jgi:allantoicase
VTRTGADHSTAAFIVLPDLASARVGGRAIAASDDFFAPRSNLVKPGPPVFVPGKYTTRGKWMDGWESRRRRTPGHDWCIVELGLRGVIHGVNVDTRFFAGNAPTHCSLDAVDAGKKSRLVFETAILPKLALHADRENLFAVEDRRAWTHVRLNIFPDGGVARLRIHGEAAVDWHAVVRAGRTLDLASILHGGLVLGASDRHFGRPDHLIMPGRARSMADGWETRRRRDAGHDWAVVRLGAPGRITRVEIDTAHFKGNYPDSASLEGCLAPGAALDALDAAAWREIVPRAKLRPDARHVFSKGLGASGAVSHVRLNIFPDGGVSRLRVHGTVVLA